MSSENRPALTGYPSIDRPWMKHWPPELLQMMQIPECNLNAYLQTKAPSEKSLAMHYYGKDIL